MDRWTNCAYPVRCKIYNFLSKIFINNTFQNDALNIDLLKFFNTIKYYFASNVCITTGDKFKCFDIKLNVAG